MTAERLNQAVRHQLGLVRHLPLGEAADGAWVTEQAAIAVLGGSVRSLPGVRLGAVRVELTSPRAAVEPAVPPPPGALPPGPLTLTAELAAPADRPVPEAAQDVRHALLTAAERELGLWLESVDLRVTELVEAGGADAGPARVHEPESAGAAAGAGVAGVSGAAGAAQHAAADRVTRAVLAVEGVARLAPVASPALSRVAAGPAAGDAVRIEGDPEGGPCHVLLQLGLSPTRCALETARAAGDAAREALGASGKATAAVLVTAIDRV